MRTLRRLWACILTLPVTLAFVAAAPAVPAYDIVGIGLADAEHTYTETGYKDIRALAMNDAGQVIGQSARFFGHGGTATAPSSAWLYNGNTTINIGLTGPEHTGNDGYKLSVVRILNEAGQAVGYSDRYLGGLYSGQTAWLHDDGSTINIGLSDAEHTGTGGWKYSFPGHLNEAGHVIGEADRFNGGNSNLGDTAWLYSGTATINIGLTGAEHTRNDGFKRSVAQHLTNAGQVVGYSNRYNANVQLGQTAWYYNGSSTIPIGFTGTGFARGNGWKYSASDFVSDSGKVLGYSERYTNQGDFGRAAWLFDGSNTIELGLLDAEHTAFGINFSSARALNDLGQATGYSNRYNGGFDLGRSAWIYNGTTTTKIGLTDAEHTRNDGFKHSAGYAINEAGQILGFSNRYNGTSASRGQTAWLYDGGNTTALGLTDAAHTGANTYRYSLAESINEAGQVIGYTDRYNGGATRLGQSAWLYDGTASINLGLTEPEFFRSDGHHFSKAMQLNDAGWVIGYSDKFIGEIDNGSTAWVYHPSLHQTIPLQPIQPTEGHVYSVAHYLGDDGIVLGYYQVYDALNTGMGERAFYYSPADGLHDLGTLIDGGIAASDWEYLASAMRANGVGQILGHGKPADQDSGGRPFMLTPVKQLAGEFNGDGVVDAADYVVWRKNSAGTYTQVDFNVWRTHFGQSAGSGSVAGANTTVPEPSTLVMLVLAAAGACSRRRWAA